MKRYLLYTLLSEYTSQLDEALERAKVQLNHLAEPVSRRRVWKFFTGQLFPPTETDDPDSWEWEIECNTHPALKEIASVVDKLEQFTESLLKPDR